MHALLLWDIDGTLIVSGGAGERALRIALHAEFGLDASLADVEMAGRTDRWIARRIFEKFGLPASDAAITRLLDAYLRALPHELPCAGAATLRGVRELVTRLQTHGRIAQGLLTGNLRRGAELKLTHHGLWAHFPFGAFGDDAELRDELGPHALRRAIEHHGHAFTAEQTFIIGDTPHDIACGKIIGANTIAVATGRHTVEELRACSPTAVFADLGDAESFLAAVIRA